MHSIIFDFNTDSNDSCFFYLTNVFALIKTRYILFSKCKILLALIDEKSE